MKSLKLLTPFVSSAVLLLCACNQEKPYTITGTLDLPAQIPYGDTVVDMPSFEESMVYLLDLDQDVVDSVQIIDNHFSFEGKVKQDDAFYAYLITQMAEPSLIVIEPGKIEINITSTISVTGSPSNDCMNDLEASLAKLNSDTYLYMQELSDSLDAKGVQLSDEEQYRIAEDYRKAMVNTLETAYEENKDNLGGAYALLMRLMDVQSAAEFENSLEDYPESIRNNQLFQLTIQQLRQYEEMSQYGSGLEDLDPSMFAPAEEDGAGN